MNRIKIRLKVLGNYAPNIKGIHKYPCSGYYIKGLSKPVILDFGIGILPRLFKELKLNNESIYNTIFIISHNHIDHSFDMIPLSMILLKRNFVNDVKNLFNKKGKKSNKKVKVYLPKRSLMYVYVKVLKNIFDIHIINEKTLLKLDGYTFSFCQAEHRGESYATKIEKENESFVYTSDIAYASRKIRAFCKNSRCTLIDSGHPNKDSAKTLPGYHGKTQEIVEDLIDSGVQRILASHLKASLKDEDYIKVFPKDYYISLAKINEEYNVL